MRTVFKYPLALSTSVLRLPAGAEILHVAAQSTRYSSAFSLDECPMLWALVDEDAPKRETTFLLVPTGDRIAPALVVAYVGTVHMAGGTFVLHVFRVRTS